jgi:L-ascorbate metabolism protein UlaG (beta-lactamase superfamily)
MKNERRDIMKESTVRINYLFHSGFIVETEKHLLIFDYYKDTVEKGEKNRENGAIGLSELKSPKDIFVFSSHNHHDHFNPVIMDWSAIRPDIKYILDSDIKADTKNSNIYTMAVYEELLIGDVMIKSFGSTDIGISFLVKIDGVAIFHAGDLNWWYWWDDTKEEIDKASKMFKNEIDRIKGEKIDIAFFPVDPRLEHSYSLGGQYFISEITPKLFIPMHFGEDFEVTQRFFSSIKSENTLVAEISYRGQEILFEL